MGKQKEKAKANTVKGRMLQEMQNEHGALMMEIDDLKATLRIKEQKADAIAVILAKEGG